ncbi:MAG: hypothetical protein ACTSRI_22250 [Promethearchaeota archaeon]
MQDKKKVLEIILKIYKEFSNVNKKVRLVGIKLSNLEKNLNSFIIKLLNSQSIRNNRMFLFFIFQHHFLIKRKRKLILKYIIV